MTLNQDQMMADLAATFPGLWARPLAEFGKRWKAVEGIWTGAGDTRMPDGLLIFDAACPDPDHHDGGVHHAFTAWLEARGWSTDRYDDTVFFLVPLSYFDDQHGPAAEARE